LTLSESDPVQAQACRENAVELRRFAARNETCRDAIIAIARSYERLALKFEEPPEPHQSRN